MTDDQCLLLYRFVNKENETIYVGITKSASMRFVQHAEGKPWWSEVVSIELVRHPDRDSALLAETLEITRDQPKYNVQHNPNVHIHQEARPFEAFKAITLLNGIALCGDCGHRLWIKTCKKTPKTNVYFCGKCKPTLCRTISNVDQWVEEVVKTHLLKSGKEGWESFNLEEKRRIINDLCTVRLLRAPRGRMGVSVIDTVEIGWKKIPLDYGTPVE